MNQIWNSIKGFIIPLVAGLIIFPVKLIFEFNGIVYQKARFNKNRNIEIKFTYQSDEILNGLVIQTYLMDTSVISYNYRSGMYLDKVPSDQSFRTSAIVYNAGTNYKDTRAISISELDKGEYVLYLPIITKTTDKKVDFKKKLIIEFRQEIDKRDDLKIVNTKEYKFYYVTFFHPWLTSISLIILTLSVQFIINKRKQKLAT